MVDVHITTFQQLWREVIGVQEQPSLMVVAACGVAALLTVTVRDTWRLTRGVATIAHEGGHAIVALVAGRRLSGIRLHSDTSGVTVSRGRPTGPGMVATAFAGYVAPSLLGLAYAGMLTRGHITALLWISIGLLAAMVLLIRNAYGLVSILTTGLTLFAVSWFADDRIQAALAYAFTWFLLFAGVRPVGELQRKRATGYARDSDADQLARLTGVPGLVWVMAFGVVALAALALAGSWLLPWSELRTLPARG